MSRKNLFGFAERALTDWKCVHCARLNGTTLPLFMGRFNSCCMMTSMMKTEQRASLKKTSLMRRYFLHQRLKRYLVTSTGCSNLRERDGSWTSP